MPRKRSLPSPDLRPNWRDPAMPVNRDYRMGDGLVKTVVDPDYEHRYRAHMMEAAPHPHWKDDPSYNWSKKK